MSKYLTTRVKHDEAAYTVEVDLPGYKKSTLELNLTAVSDYGIKINGSAAKTEDAKTKDTILLGYRVSPTSLKLDEVRAKLEDGVLTITLPVADAYKTRLIPIE